MTTVSLIRDLEWSAQAACLIHFKGWPETRGW